MAMRISTLRSPPFSTTSSSSSRILSSSSALHFAAVTPSYSLRCKSLNMYFELFERFFYPKPFIPSKRGAVVMKAASDSDGPIIYGGQVEDESDDEYDLLFDKVPLDSKLQQKLEHKMKMKFSKSIRLRRKKIVHQRRLSKRGGHWPKTKNV